MENNFFKLAGRALAMQPGRGLAFIAARGHTADSYSVCPPLAPGPLVCYFSDAGLMNLTDFSMSTSLQAVKRQLNGIPILDPSLFGDICQVDEGVLYHITQVCRT